LFVFLNPTHIRGMPVSVCMITAPFRSSFLTYRPSGCECYCLWGSRSTSLHACHALILWIVMYVCCLKQYL